MACFRAKFTFISRYTTNSRRTVRLSSFHWGRVDRLLDPTVYSLANSFTLPRQLFRKQQENFDFPMAQETLVGHSLLIIEASQLHSDTPQSVGLLWTNDQPDAETSTMSTYNNTDRHPCPPAGFEPTIPVSERPKTHAWDRAAAGMGGYITTLFSKASRNMRKCKYCAHNVFRHHILKNVHLSALITKLWAKHFDLKKQELTEWWKLHNEAPCSHVKASGCSALQEFLDLLPIPKFL